MGHGDWVIATAQAKAHFARTGRKVAFGDGTRAWWSEVFENNPKVIHPDAMPADGSFDWIANYGGGHRPYLAAAMRERYVFNAWRPEAPGEFFFTEAERQAARRHGGGFVVIEPTVKPGSPNKQWPADRFKAVARALAGEGLRLVQFNGAPLPGAELVETARFRDAAAVLANASLYIGPEGGLHHAAAALDVPAVVIFGGFISPSTTGYPGHVNLFAGGEACGNRLPCRHCAEAMDRIGADRVIAAALGLLNREAA